MALGTHTFTEPVSGTNFTFSRGNTYPVKIPSRKIQVRVESAGGVQSVQDMGKEVILHELTFAFLGQTDRDNLRSFVRTTVNYGEKTFTWNDLLNANHTVRLQNNPFDDVEMASGVFGPYTLVLREEV